MLSAELSEVAVGVFNAAVRVENQPWNRLASSDSRCQGWNGRLLGFHD